jgi:hypothetical protein
MLLLAVIAVLPFAQIEPWLFGLRDENAELGEDWAVLRIEAPPEVLPTIAIGTSGDLEVGQKVFAVGNRFGFDQTLTAGVVGGLG